MYLYPQRVRIVGLSKPKRCEINGLPKQNFRVWSTWAVDRPIDRATAWRPMRRLLGDCSAIGCKLIAERLPGARPIGRAIHRSGRSLVGILFSSALLIEFYILKLDNLLKQLI